MMGEGFPDSRPVLPARRVDLGGLAWSAGNVVRRGEPDRHRGEHLAVDAQLSPDQVLGPRATKAHLDGKSDDESGAVIGQGRRHAEVVVEGTLPSIVVQSIEEAFSPAYRTAGPPVSGRRGYVADNHARRRRYARTP